LGSITSTSLQKERKMKIKVLGPGCKKCHETEKVVKAAVAEAGVTAEVEYVTDLAEIARHGIFSTPAVVIDGVVKVTGKIPSKGEVLRWLK
jgi:small redox-active disulfide protein 2